MTRKVLVIGSGGREHALIRQLAASPRKPEIFVATGNPGTADLAHNLHVNPADGAAVVAPDVSEQAVDWARSTHPQVDLVDDTDVLIRQEIDVYAPCALGGALDDDTVPALRAAIVAGAANNQLAHPGVEKLLDAAQVD